ncbi:hypothetical protein GF319_13755 [Candidatus Bathyarchaeota archaeon]|nr:hypothetical protein [Candidatus Bathyarchaeota archaeon]
MDLFYSPIFSKETLSSQAQVVGQDLVNLFLGVPALAISLIYSKKGSIKSRIILIGVLAYLAYTFLSYGVLFKLNPGFILYTADFAVSLYATLLAIAGFEIDKYKIKSDEKTRKNAQYSLIFVILIIILLWTPDLVLYYLEGVVPQAITQEGFHTLIIPFQDFSIILPLALLTIWLLRNERGWGYVLAPLLLVKVFSIAVAVIGMIIVMSYYGTPLNITQVGIFSLSGLIISCYINSYLKNIEINRKN